MTGPIVFMDTETTGLAQDDHVWEFAAIRREDDGSETSFHTFVQHDTDKARRLDESFLTDYRQRYDSEEALSPWSFRRAVAPVFAGRPHIIGAVPDFDTTRLSSLLGTNRVNDPWHYHIQDVETLVVGYLRGKLASDGPSWSFMSAAGTAELIYTLPWDAEELSRAVGVNPGQFEKHTAMGDTLWVRALYDAVMGDPPERLGTRRRDYRYTAFKEATTA